MKLRWWVIPGIATLNIVSGLLTTTLALPFYLDTWATAAGAVLGGFSVGAIGGVLSNVVIAAIQRNPLAAIWALSSVLVAGLAVWLARRGWMQIEEPLRLVCAGFAIGITNTALTVLISTLFPGATYGNTELVKSTILAMTDNPPLALMGEQLVVEIMDKTVSIIIAALVVMGVREFLPQYVFSSGRRPSGYRSETPHSNRK